MNKSSVKVENNLAVYEQSKTVKYYEHLSGLQKCEQYLFKKYVQPDIDVLDLGVGGGRTTIFLSSDERRYIGVDYSREMIEVCRSKFPALPFYVLDASDLSIFDAGQFDVIVFSFNGIDYLYPDGKREQCLKEVSRLLRPGGKFIFSVHNARVIFVRPQLRSINLARIIWRLMRTIKNVGLLFRQLTNKSFYNGIGYIKDSSDPAHNGLLIHTSIPTFVKKELIAVDLEVLEIVSSTYPVSSGDLTSPWYYYVAKKV